MRGFAVLRRMCVAVSVLALQVAAARAEPAIWLVQSPTAKVYLFGTMHILPKHADWFGPKIAAAFADSHVLVEEADVGFGDPKAVAGIMGQAIAPDFDLWAKLPAASAVKFRSQLVKCHLPDSVVGHFRPWFASMLPTICGLMDKADGTLSVAASSPEAALAARAKQAGKSQDYFETAAQQIGYLSGASEAVQMKELESAIDEGDSGGDDFNGMEASWLAGDVPALAKLVGGMHDKGADFYDVIFTQRNARFASRIGAMLRESKTVFVAIGAGHLAGPDSVQALLAKAGVVSRRL